MDIDELTRIMGRACAGDFSEKPPIPEKDDAPGRFTAGLRFLIDELELARKHRDDEIERWKELDRVKTRFVNTAAHELATPLTPILLQIHQMRALTDDENVLRSVEVVDRNMKRVVRLVDDLLDVARLESGRMPIRPRAADLQRILQEVEEGAQAAAGARGVRLRLAADAPVEAAVDVDRFHQVAENLVSNALKFTPAGGTVTLRAWREEDEAHIEVRDNGIGMTGEQIVALFQPFSQVHDTNPHDVTTGSGLGLYICKGLIEQHGGLIWCESPGPGEGSCFRIILPSIGKVAEGAGEDATVEPPAPSAPLSPGPPHGSARRSA